jgi:NAD(P)H-flavin reductase/hemoglobin-like flavoprotein
MLNAMDERTISLVRTTFKSVSAQDDGPEKLARSCYAILFRNYPQIRDVFPVAMDSQRDRMMRALAYMVDRLEDLDQLLPFLAQLGRDHRKYGVGKADYRAVCDALTRALQTFAGNEVWTDDVGKAWSDVLSLIAETMTAAADAESRRLPPVWGATVVAHRLPLRDLAIVRLRLNQPMWYEPGQYVSVQVPARPRMWRYLSPAVPPNDHGEIEFHVRGVPAGWVSSAIVHHTGVGDRWLLSAPLGHLGSPARPGRDVLMVACGAGIAPMRAQLLAMAHRRDNDNANVHLFVGGRHPCDLYDLDMLWQLSLANPWLTVTPVSERDENPWWFDAGSSAPSAALRHRRTGPIGDLVAEHGPWTDHDVQIAGPPSMVQTTKFRLLKAGVPGENIQHDPIS